MVFPTSPQETDSRGPFIPGSSIEPIRKDDPEKQEYRCLARAALTNQEIAVADRLDRLAEASKVQRRRAVWPSASRYGRVGGLSAIPTFIDPCRYPSRSIVTK